MQLLCDNSPSLQEIGRNFHVLLLKKNGLLGFLFLYEQTPKSTKIGWVEEMARGNKTALQLGHLYISIYFMYVVYLFLVCIVVYFVFIISLYILYPVNE